ncbi:phthiocerol dimycocerosate exporter MmpL7 [Mycobacterium lacus]|uniref:Phthiocerol dimycocerosate exporter MmpL7 n=1 Tax=Mycobacterium lacus TaxID=169765 RepID=A0A7I7NLP3_9MYCO|nr:MMPL family transporter [Mycobacterium lacus]MCV7122092.1 MMPL family transporter [Mycobacterium lacus]BBX97586.1 phthiocerol dimycocerosate exporter MmpL7 [Mycobacterium lacus]
MPADGSHRSSRLANLLVVAAWISVAVIANVILALTQGKASDAGSALLPRDATTAAVTGRIAKAFPGTGTNAIAYLLLDGHDTLGPADQPYYDAVVAALRADTRHVGSVLDLWSDPLTAPLGTGPDGRSGIAMVWLVGEAGSAQAHQSLDAARSVVGKVPLHPGLRARIVVPASTSGMPMHMSAWQGAAIVTAAALIAVLLLLRARQPRIVMGIALLTAGLSLAVAWPLAAVVRGDHGGSMSVFAVTVAAVLAIATITTSAMLVVRLRPGAGCYRDALPALALPGACVAMLTAPLLLARTPALHSVGTAALGVVVALAASLTLLPALLGIAGPSSQPSSGAGGAAQTPALSMSRAAVVTAVVLAICALPVVGMRWGISENPTNPAGTGSARLFPGTSPPDVVVIEAVRDLRDPAGLIAIDQASHRLMEIPGVRRVQSAAWPAGIPWADASLTSAAGRLSDQLDRGAGNFMPQVNAIKSMRSMVDQMTGAVNELEKSVNLGLAGAAQIQQNVDVLLSGTRNIKGMTVELSGYLDPVRGWMDGVENCPADQLCSAVRKVVGPVDRVVGDVALLSDGADRIAEVSRRTMGAFASAPHVVAEMKSVLAQLRSFVPSLETTIQDTLPQLVQVSAFLKSLSTDFADTGEGGFYLSRKALADPSYQHVRQTMFSSDGTVTRLFVYSDGNRLGLDTAARVRQLEIAVGKAAKYGSLLDSEMTVSGGAHVATAVRGALTHDAVLLAVMTLAVAVLVGMWRGAVGGLVVGLAVLASYLAALGIAVALWQYLLGRELHASVPLVAFALLAACGVPYLLALGAARTDAGSAGTVSVRGAVAPLVALGAALGLGLVLVSGGSFSALGQLGAVLVIGVGALTAVAHVCNPGAIHDRNQRPTATASAAALINLRSRVRSIWTT